MEENKVVEQVAEVAKEAGMTVIDMPPIPTARGMNGWVVAGATGVGLLVGGLLTLGVTKIVRGIKSGAFKSKKKKEEEEYELHKEAAKEANADEDFFDEDK